MRKLSLINRQLPEGTSAAADGDTDSKRKQVSKRLFLKADSTEAERMEEAQGGRYVLLDPNGNHDLDYIFGQNPTADKFYAIFGYHTKTGNVANTVLNDKDEPGTPGDAAAAIREFQTGVTNGVWAERTTGGVGAKIDKDALAGAIVTVALAGGKITEAQRDTTYAKVRDRLETEPAYVRSARQVPDVAREYATRVGKATKEIGDLL